MGDTENTKKAPKKSFWKGLKAEYKRIIWPDKETVTKQTGAVIAVSVALGLIIAALDTATCLLAPFLTSITSCIGTETSKI